MLEVSNFLSAEMRHRYYFSCVVGMNFVEFSQSPLLCVKASLSAEFLFRKFREIQIRSGNRDNSKIIFLFFNRNIPFDPLLEPFH